MSIQFFQFICFGFTVLIVWTFLEILYFAFTSEKTSQRVLCLFLAVIEVLTIVIARILLS